MSETAKGLEKDRERKDLDSGDIGGLTEGTLGLAKKILVAEGAEETSEAEEEFPNEAETTEARKEGRETAPGISTGAEGFSRI